MPTWQDRVNVTLKWVHFVFVWLFLLVVLTFVVGAALGWSYPMPKPD